MRFIFSQPHKILIGLVVSGFVLVSFFGYISSVDAAPNYQMNYQGKLTNASNVAVADGTYNMRFWLLTSPSIATTSALWTEELTGTDKVTVTNGLFSVMLGSTSPLTGIDFNQTLYLGVEIGSTTVTAEWDGEMSPRKILGTVPSAFEAKNTQTFAGIATTSFLRSDQADTASGLLTFTGGFVSNSSSTITDLTTLIATTTTLVINGEAFTDLTGSGFTNSANALTCATSGSATFGCLTASDWTSFNNRISSSSIDTENELETFLTDVTNVLTNNDLAYVSSSSLNIANWTNKYVLMASTTAPSGFDWVATSTLGLTAAGDGVSNWLTQNGALTPSSTLGIRINASSTIGDGTGTGGLTVSGNSTTTGNANIGGSLGIGVASTTDMLEVAGNITSRGIKWTGRTGVGFNNWQSVTYGNGRFVAVANAGSDERVMTSVDGINWATTTPASASAWKSVIYGNGLFVAVGSSVVMTSPDGLTWTARTPASASTWTSVTYNKGLFVAVGSSVVMTSPDGITWTSRTPAEATTWQSVTYGNGLFVAVANAGTDQVMTSPDGIIWTSRSEAQANTWISVTYGNGLFVAVSGNGTNRIMTSPDGISWTAQTPPASTNWKGVTYGDGLFVAVSGSAGSFLVQTSPDGINWSQRSTLGTDCACGNSWNAIGYGNGMFVVVSTGGGGEPSIMTSGKTFTNALAHNNILQGNLSVFSSLQVGTSTVSDNLFRVASTTGISLFNINNNGYVGIGSTTPSRLFTVAGDGYFTNLLTAGYASTTGLTATNANITTGLFNLASSTYASTTNLSLYSSLFDRTSSAGTNGMVLQTNGSGVTWVATSTLGFGSSLTGGTDGYLARWTSASALSTGLFRDNGTVAGVNATTSTSTFLVQGTAGVNPFTVASSTGSALLTILQNGNVGIGTTTPSTKLSVSGQTYSDSFDASFGGYKVNGFMIATASTSADNYYFGSTTEYFESTSGLTHNIALGTQAMQFATSGAYNVALGYQAMQGNQLSGIQGNIGSSNNAIGGQSLLRNYSGSNNNAFGVVALVNNESGSNNSAFGDTALLNNSGGSLNTAAGKRAGQTNSTGNANTYLGAYADGASNNLSTSTAIGAGAIVGCTNCMVLGGTGMNYANVGIGTTTPSRLLTVQGGDFYLGGNLTATGTLNVSGLSTLSYASTTGLTATNANITTGLFNLASSTYASTTNLSLYSSLFDRTSSAGTNGMVLQTNGSGVTWVATSTLGFGSSLTGGTDGYLARWTSASALSTGLFRDNGTVAGVNATTSTSTFLVQGTAGVNPFTVASSTGSALLTILQNGNVGIGTTSPSSALSVVGATANSIFSVSSSTSSAIFGVLGNGKIGLGTNNPSALFDIQTTNPSITLIKASYPSLTNVTTITGLDLALTNATSSNASVTGASISLPNSSNSNAAQSTGLFVFGPASFTQSNAAKTADFKGVSVSNPSSITGAVDASVVAHGFDVSTGYITTAGIQRGLNITASGVGAGTLNGINISSITGGAGTEDALVIGTGWDTILNTGSIDISGTGAITGATGFVTSGSIVASSSIITFASSTALTVSGNSYFNFASATNASTTGLTATNANITNATGSTLYGFGLTDCDADGQSLSWDTTTGTFVCGDDDTGADGGSHWITQNGALTPSSTIGIRVNASSTIGDGTATGGLTIFGNATTTNLTVTALTATRALFTDSTSKLTTTGTSQHLIDALTDETGTGSAVFSASPTFTGTAIFANSSSTFASSTNASTTGLTALNAYLTTLSGVNTLTLSTTTAGVLLTNSSGLVSASTSLADAFVSDALTLTNSIGLPISTGVSGLGSNVATFLGTPSSANLAAALTDETGSAGSVVFSGSPLFTGTAQFAGLTVSASSTLGYASSTALTVAGNSFLTYASTTALSGTNAYLTYASTTGLTATNANITTGLFNLASSTYASTTNLSLYGSLFDRTSSAGTNGMVLQTNGSGVTWVATSTLGLTAAGDGVSNWLFNGSRLSPSSTVGIGIFASSTIGGGTGATGLTINGGATTTGNAYVAGNMGIGIANPTAKLHVSNTTNTSVIIGNQDNDSTQSSLAFQGKSGGGTALSSTLTLSTGGFLTLSTQGATEAITVNTITGNVGLGLGSTNPQTKLHIGDSTTNSSVDSQILISRVVDDDTVGNGHAFSDSSSVTRSGTIAYNSYDARTLFAGTNSYDHYAGFQTIPTYNSAGTMTNYYGLYSGIAVDAGTVTNSYGAYFANPTGTGAVTNAYGLYIAPITKGSTSNYGLYVDGTNKSYLAYASTTGLTATNANITTGLFNLASSTYASTTNLSLYGSLFDRTSSAGTNGMVLQTNGSGVTWVATSSLGITSGSSFSDSAGLAAILSDETGSAGSVVFSGSPLFTGTAQFSGLTVSASSTLGFASSSALTVSGNSYFTYASTTALTISGPSYHTGTTTIGTTTIASAFIASTTITNATTTNLKINALVDSANTLGTAGSLLQTNGSAATWVATSSLFSTSAQFAQWLSDETGTGGVVFSASPTFTGTAIFANSSSTFASSTNASTTGLTALNAVITNGTTTNATSTNLKVSGLFTLGSDQFTSLLGSGLINSTNALTCATSNGSTFGCLTSADWTSFNGRVSSTSVDTSAELATLLTDEVGGSGSLVFNAAPYFTGTTGFVNATTSGNVSLGTSTLSAKLTVWGTDTSPSTRLANFVNSASTSVLSIFNDGKLALGTTTPTSIFTMGSSSLSGARVAGIKQYFGFTNNTLSAVYYGDESYLVNAPTATSTLVGKMIRIEDTSVLGNTVRGFEAQAHRGTNTKGENTGLSGFGRTFGVRGTTIGDAGDTFLPAGVFAESQGTTQGNALRAYSGTLTTENLVSLFHDTSVWSGTGLNMNFGNAGGSFAATSSAKFLDFQVAGTSKFTVAANGSTTIGDGVSTSSLRIPFGGICVDNDGSCIATTTGQIRSVTSVLGNSDLAEIYFSSQSLHAGEIVALTGGLSVARAKASTEKDIVGVVSTKPGTTLGFDDTSLIPGETGYPVGLKGRVPVKLSTENGSIKKGDRITLSSIPGIGMKATESSRVVGIALEDYDGSRAYSAGFLNQFGDDMVKERITKKTMIDPQTQDGCYNGGGSALGEKPCTPDAVTTTSVTTVTDDAEYRNMLASLRTESPQTMTTEEGASFAVGQVIMFIDLGWFKVDAESTVLAELVATTTYEGTDETIWSRLKAIAQNFVDGVLTLTGLKADRVDVKNELCVDGVCVTADDLRALLESVRTPADTSDEEHTEEDTGGGDTVSDSGETGEEENTDDASGDTGTSGTGDAGSEGSGTTDTPSSAEPPVTDEGEQVSGDGATAEPEPTPEPEPEPEPEQAPSPEPSPSV